jgi:hypothetical protein
MEMSARPGGPVHTPQDLGPSTRDFAYNRPGVRVSTRGTGPTALGSGPSDGGVWSRVHRPGHSGSSDRGVTSSHPGVPVHPTEGSISPPSREVHVALPHGPVDTTSRPSGPDIIAHTSYPLYIPCRMLGAERSHLSPLSVRVFLPLHFFAFNTVSIVSWRYRRSICA